MIGPHHRKRASSRALLAAVVAVAAAGCATGARVQLSAADALTALAQAVERAAGEYHAEISTADAARRQGAVNAFIRRIRADRDDEQATARHIAEFNAALDRLRQDGEIENARYAATIDNVRAVRRIGAELRHLAVQSMTFDDELRRYVTDLLSPERPHATGQPPSTPGGT